MMKFRFAALAAWVLVVGLTLSSPAAEKSKPQEKDKDKPSAAETAKPAEKKSERAAKPAEEAPASPYANPYSAAAPASSPYAAPTATPSAAKPATTPTKPAAKQANKASAAKKEREIKKLSVARLTIKGELPEGPIQSGLFGELQPSLGKLIDRMDEAAADKAVAAVWLRIEDLELGRGKIHELRAAVARLRKAGKPVYAELTTADTGQYLLAAACDQVVMPPSGMLFLPGVRAEVTFLKGLLDKLGLEFDALQMGKYKSAAEPLTRKEMSKPFRESLDAIVDDVYEQMAATIAADRRLKDYQVKTLIDQGLFTASSAKRAGLVDDVLYADQFEESLAKRLGADKIDLVTNYKKKQIDTDFSGLGGLMKLIELFSGGKPSEKGGAKPKIAVVYAVGPIVEGKGASQWMSENSIGSTTMVENLRKAADDPKVAAIVLRIDSPGGSAVASDLIWRETARLKKPLIASMGDVAGSGGYYIAMAARRIVAEPGTLTGSIGVIGGKLVTRGLCDKIGVTSEVISRGKLSGTFSSDQPFSADERKAITDILLETYGQFVAKAAQGRKMSPARLEQLAQGRVYTGRMAKNLGLVDQLGTLKDAIVEAKKAAGLKPEAEVDLLILPHPKTFFEQLFSDASVGDELESAMPEAVKILRQAQLWRQLLREPVLLWMPCAVKVR
ncbi:MAG: signal peptide peptidase SppA [Thermoguttaceae bacterium]|jgi:protease-4